MRIVCVSDSHTMGPKVLVPDGDLLIHAGDHTFTGTKNEIFDAFKWLASLPHKHKLAIAGNHDLMFENEPARARGIIGLYNITYLEDRAVTIDGVKFYGSPWTPYFQGNPNYTWVFNLPRGDAGAARAHWARIPDDVDVLITHGPPRGILDIAKPRSDPRIGDVQLGDRVSNLQENRLRLHVFGHIHGSYGQETHGATTFVNAAVNTEDYDPINAPIVIDFEPARLPGAQVS